MHQFFMYLYQYEGVEVRNMPTLNKFLKLFFPQMRLNRSLRILVVVNAILVFLMGLFAPFYAVFVLHIGGTLEVAGLSWAVFSAVSGMLVILFANWEVHIKEQKRLLAASYLLRGGVFLSYALMGGMVQLVFTQILLGVSGALGSPSFDALYSLHTTKEDSIAQWSGWEGVASIATALAALVGGVIIQEFGYQIIFMLMALVSVSIGVYTYMLPTDVL